MYLKRIKPRIVGLLLLPPALLLFDIAASLVRRYLTITDRRTEHNIRKNVLMLIADDFRAHWIPEVSESWSAGMRTPALDALAAQSTVFRRAYVQQAHCCPSRSSFLTGRRPDTIRVYDIRTAFRTTAGNLTTLPQYFRQQGYATVGIGKVFHGSQETGGVDPPSWSEPFLDPPYFRYSPDMNVSWLAVPEKDYKEQPLTDQLLTQEALKTLRNYKSGGNNHTNFFMAVGFRKPHLPFIFPKEYLDLYPEGSIKLPSNPYVPSQMPHSAWSNWKELRSFKDISRLHVSGEENATLPDDVTMQLRRAYSASVSYIDHQVGLVLRELEIQGLAKDTIVVFLGDHGWMLGEHGGWCKQNNFELSTHAPLILRVPGQTDVGKVADHLVEFVDIFPTLVELAGLPKIQLCPQNSSSDVPLCTEGSSLVPLITGNSPSKWKDRAFSQYPRKKLKIMGYSMRTERYRYTEWVQFDPVRFKPVWTAPLKGVELYDHEKDPLENTNVAESVQYMDARHRLSQMLREGWRPALPGDGHTRGTDNL